MIRRASKPLRALALVLGVFLLWFLLPMGAKFFLQARFWEFQAPAWTALSYLRDLQDYWALRTRPKAEIIQAGVDQARLNAAYEVRNQLAVETEAELARLEALLGLERAPEFHYLVARVVARDQTVWWQRLTIRRGWQDGVRPGQGVIFQGGAAGRVLEVYQYTAVVELLTSPRFRIAAHFADEKRPVQFQGRDNPAFRDPVGEVSTVPVDLQASLRAPLRLVTSRLGGSFPDGLTIGQVYQLEPGADGLFQRGLVRLDPRLQELREVVVLVPVDPTEADAPARPNAP